MTVGYLLAGFDLLNVRHLDLIGQAAERCSRLVVGVLSDDLVARLSGRDPVVGQDERAALVGHVRGVDQISVRDSVAIPDLGVDVVVFAVDDEPVPLVARDIVTLTPSCTSRSPILRHALRRVDTEAAA